MFKRDISSQLLSEATKFKAFALVGPRQSGKTTLLRTLFPEYDYLSLESPDTLNRVRQDPRGVFHDPQKKWIIDESQNWGDLFSYMQEFIDDPQRQNRFIFSGSQNFLLHQNISQSLAGRVGLYELLPLTYHEFETHENLPSISLWDYLFQGQYPRLYHEQLPARKWIESYLKSYVERDLRMIENIKDLSKFQLFLKLCAGYHGQQLNILQLSIDCGVSQPTIQNWLSILEASFIIFRLQPYYKNYSKRLVKSSKLYFYDSGIVCYLLGIESSDHLQLHTAKGAIFEGFIISEFIKNIKNFGLSKGTYYWKTSGGLEVDLLMEGNPLKGIEVKSGSTFQSSFISGLQEWQSISNENTTASVVYAGLDSFTFKNIPIIPWDKIWQHFFSVDA